MLRDTLKAIDHWMTNLFIVALQCAGIGLIFYALFGMTAVYLSVGFWLLLTGLTAKKREEFVDNRSDVV